MRYIKLDHSEQVYGKKNLLYCEMEILNTIKRLGRYKALRKQEISLKKLLKKATSELKEELKKFDNLLPEHKGGLSISASKNTPKRSELETEIEAIRNKIAELS